MVNPIHVRGAGSAIAQALATLTPIESVPRPSRAVYAMPVDAERYLFCAGLQIQKRIGEQEEDEVEELFWVNAGDVIRECDRLIEENPRARICVIGSEAAYTWGFNGTYAAAKAALHRYVETKRLKHPGQQLVCVAPTMIVGTGMNRQRNADGVAAAERRRLAHPKQRWLQPIEVARLVHFLLVVDEGYVTNCVVRMNGGEHCR